MSSAIQDTGIDVDQYLEDELRRDVKYELIDGQIYAMADASANHERISSNISRYFGNHLQNSPCEPFGSDMKVKVGSRFFYPDVIVDCQFDETEPYYTESPVIIVEVLSKSTRRIDETTKRFSYMNIPGLQEYVLIEQDIVDIEVIRRSEGWVSKHYYLGDKVHFESINLTLSVEEIHHRVNNEEVHEFIGNQ
ncbi:hypothetical protein BMR07_08985 [Methylococcaceae bacterium CS1]|nr:Uma2 family endonuclease [Methyloprofundus sp.]TXK97548.1 hypothetical protein BMR10_04940 [Methylococcaceae bacterium CS4]TXK97634.1 hypothetical protein BMR11_09760 [Methylococcaceae bacterium CS5]TXL05388.1 hypothetical protein BMR09_10230 [Methylococcaceae bacterium CS3]TXL05715.1 hypothetical protein BMR07_08985 [Methylococcaceae bacterium CS1]TXL09609.1 hypothetical protein BMR08_13120 [Methylococcaceae bacterium CS2]